MERDDLMKLVMERSKKIFAFILAGIMLAALGGCGFRIPFSGESEASFPAKDSSPISGTPQIENEEITLPCTVKDLIDRRFETDYLFEKGYVKMWHHAEEKRGNYLSMFLILGNRSKYKEQDKISDDDTVVAIMVTQFYNIKFDLNGIHLWQDKEDVLKIAGTPAYEKKMRQPQFL